ncbi:MAG: hypothetical protein ABJB16_04475 [Saprospiraceae bacterium]
METTPYTVRPYVIPMLFCVVVSTTAIKIPADFASREIFSNVFNSDTSSVVLVQHVIIYPSISIAHPDWTYTNRCVLSIFVKSQTRIPIIGQMENTIDNSDSTYSIHTGNAFCEGSLMLLKWDETNEMKRPLIDIDQSDSIHIL